MSKRAAAEKAKKAKYDHQNQTNSYNLTIEEFNQKKEALKQARELLAAGHPNDPLVIYNEDKFCTVNAWMTYVEWKNMSIPVVEERGFDDEWGGLPSIKKAVEKMKLERLLDHDTEGGYLELCYEFYANLTSHKNNDVIVRGKTVDISSWGLNDCFGVPQVSNGRCEFKKLIEAGISRESLEATICVPSAKNTIQTTKKTMTVPMSSLNMEAKVWSHVISKKLFPHKHMASLDTQRAVLVYCLMKGNKVDFGKIIYEGFFEAFRRKELWFPNLITKLCVHNGVEVNSLETCIPPGLVLGKASVAKMKIEGKASGSKRKPRHVADVGCSSANLGTGVDRLLHKKIEKLAELIVESTEKAAYYAKCAWRSASNPKRRAEEPTDYERPDLSFFHMTESEDDASEENDEDDQNVD